MSPKEKIMWLRIRLRKAIKAQNNMWKFSCGECMYCVPVDPEDTKGLHVCSADVLPVPSYELRPATQVLDCFIFGQNHGAFGDVVAWMIVNGFDIMNAQHGWATVVRRIIKRSTRHGHFMNVSRSNLEKFS